MCRRARQLLGRRSSFCAAFLVLVLCVASFGATLPSVGAAATSSTVVGATVPSSIALADQCGARVAWSFDMVLPGTPDLTDGAGSVCRFTFSSTNSSSMLRAWQTDRAGTAMNGTSSAAPFVGSSSQSQWIVSNAGTSLLLLSRGDAASGSYFRSLDNGVTWDPFNPGDGTHEHLSVASASVAWRFGSGGSHRSADANASPGPPAWAAVSNTYNGGGSWINPKDSVAIDYDTAWVLADSHYMYRTDATLVGGAEPWLRAHTSCTNARGIDAVDATTAYAAGTDRICRTVDANVSWQFADTSSGLPSAIYRDVMASPGAPATVWAVGNGGTVARSVNAGVNWSATPTSPTTLDLHSIEVRSATEAFVGGRDGMIFRTTDAGATWARIRTPIVGTIRSLAASDASTIVASAPGDIVWSSTNGGSTWTNRSGEVEDSIRDIDAIDDQTYITAQGTGLVRVSTNAGSTWTSRAVGIAPDNVRGVAMVDTSRFIAVGDQGSIVVTEDGGATWTRRASGTSADLWDVDIGSDGVAIAVGASGTILRSSDNGWNWTVRSAAGADLRRVSVRQNGPIVAVGVSGTIRRSGDGGLTWTTPASGMTGMLDSVTVASPTVVFAGGGGYVLKSTDAGATWTATVDAFAGHVVAANEDVVWATKDFFGGNTQWVKLSVDGGATWTQPMSNANPNVTVAHALDGNRVLFGGEGGILRRTNPGTAIGDYAGGAWAGVASIFGACLQDVGGAAAPGSWTEDAGGATPGSCIADDADPWNAVPSTPTKIAQMAAAGTGNVDIVWGFRPAGTQVAGTYTAGIVFEAVAPNV